MHFFDAFTQFVLFKFFKYIRFSGFSDDAHLVVCCDLLETKYQGNNGVVKEINILGMKSQNICIKSTAYFIKLHSEHPELFKKPISWSVNQIPRQFEYNQNSVFNWCQLYFSTYGNPQFGEINSTAIRILDIDLLDVEIVSLHIWLLRLKYNFHRNKIPVHEFEFSILNQFQDKDIGEIMKVNSFTEGKPSTCHELGYLTTILLEIYEDTKSVRLLEMINRLMEKLHSIFITRKVIYSEVIKKSDTINISGITLIADSFLKFSRISKDFRFASAAYFLLDIVKNIQKWNLKNHVSNSFPIYNYGSPYKYPAWTLCYFVKALCLKKEVNKLIIHEVGISI